MEDFKYIIYVVICPETNLIKFIGKSTKGLEVAETHLKPSIFYNGATDFHKWLRKMYRKRLEPKVQIYGLAFNNKELNNLFNKTFRSLKAGGCNVRKVDGRGLNG